jgi:hypothetical protein
MSARRFGQKFEMPIRNFSSDQKYICASTQLPPLDSLTLVPRVHKMYLTRLGALNWFISNLQVIILFEAQAMHAVFSSADESMSIIYSMVSVVDYVGDEDGSFDLASRRRGESLC